MRSKLFSPRLGAGLVALLAAVSAGCGGTRNPIVPVEGTILFSDGEPLPAGTRLIFNPGEGGVGTAKGVTDQDGSFKVTHVSRARGAEVGKYTILLAAPEDEPEAFFKAVPPEYYEGGNLNAEVKEDMPPLDLKVKKRKQRPTRPR